MTDQAILIYCTCPDINSGQQIAQALVEENLVACVNLLPQMLSIYRWQGKLQQDSECLLLMKTIQSQFTAIQNRVRQLHSYELPELISVPINDGLPEYIDWIAQSICKDLA